MSGNVSMAVSASTFAQCDGTNFSTMGLDANLSLGKGSLGAYAGVGTEFVEKSTGVIVDLKGSLPYGNSDFSGGFRLRNNINPKSQSLQLRAMPVKFSTPLPFGDKTKLYVTPYAQTKLNYKTGKFDDPKFGGFAGVSMNIAKNTRVFVEGQLYDFTDVRKETASINAGVTITL